MLWICEGPTIESFEKEKKNCHKACYLKRYLEYIWYGKMVDLSIMGTEYINQKLNTKYLSINLPQMWHSYSMEKIIYFFVF